jgi:hypothetical protein
MAYNNRRRPLVRWRVPKRCRQEAAFAPEGVKTALKGPRFLLLLLKDTYPERVGYLVEDESENGLDDAIGEFRTLGIGQRATSNSREVEMRCSEQERPEGRKNLRRAANLG